MKAIEKAFKGKQGSKEHAVASPSLDQLIPCNIGKETSPTIKSADDVHNQRVKRTEKDVNTSARLTKSFSWANSVEAEEGEIL